VSGSALCVFGNATHRVLVGQPGLAAQGRRASTAVEFARRCWYHSRGAQWLRGWAMVRGSINLCTSVQYRWLELVPFTGNLGRMQHSVHSLHLQHDTESEYDWLRPHIRIPQRHADRQSADYLEPRRCAQSCPPTIARFAHTSQASVLADICQPPHLGRHISRVSVLYSRTVAIHNDNQPFTLGCPFPA
jgi:hypothetical protein